MTLLDHFHPPLSERRHWESIHAYWAAAIGETLNRGLLPKDYFAEVQVHVGSRIEVDVATFEDRGREPRHEEVPESGGTATYATSYHPFRRPDADRIAIWASPLTVGQSPPARWTSG